ncbi:formylglycine-generating enzyme family protein [Bacteroidota bacterium]
MKNTVHIFSFVLIAFLYSCNCEKQVVKTEYGRFVYSPPPGTVKVSENLYADKTEIANIDYREYMYWNKDVFGEESDIYQNSLPDTLLWAYQDTALKIPMITYYRHPIYNYYPVMGISYKQALDYISWRSDRVMEMLLVRNKIIQPHPQQDSNTCFTIEKYFAGRYMNYKAIKTLPVPHYRLPSPDEWEKLAGKENDTLAKSEMISENVKKTSKSDKFLYNTSEFFDFQKTKYPNSLTFTTQRMSFPANSNKLYDLIGNVAEMTTLEGIAKGGSWQHSLDESDVSKNQLYTHAENWLGFRCVCSWEYFD